MDKQPRRTTDPISEGEIVLYTNRNEWKELTVKEMRKGRGWYVWHTNLRMSDLLHFDDIHNTRESGDVETSTTRNIDLV